jgi:hypothetical protein
MPIEQKHYDRSGKYAGKTVTKTQEEINSENEALAGLLAGIGKAAGIGIACWLLLSGALWVFELLSNPGALPLPHKLFAYYYHYFFKFLFFIFEILKPVLVFAYKVPTEYLDFIKDLTRFGNLNFVLWIIALLLYIGLLFFISSIVVSAIGDIKGEALAFIAGVTALATLAPVSIWIVYFLLERIFMWLFR